MKKILLLLLIPVCSFGQITIHGRRGVVVGSGNFETLNAQELMFDVVHYAITSTVYGGATKTVNGQSVGQMAEKIAGTFPLNYVGLATPTITGVPPTLIDDKWLAFDNRPQTNYDSDHFPTIMPPFEMTLVSRNMPGQLFEAKTENGGNAIYLGDSGTPMRVYNSDGTMPLTVKLPNYETTIERVVVDTGEVDYWQNGVKVGSFVYSGRPHDEIIATVYKTFFSIGAFTNVMDYDFAAHYWKGSIFSDATYATIYASLAAKWNEGSYPNEILLNNIQWTRTGTTGAYTYTANADIQSVPAGVTAADPNTWDYQWFWKDDETNYDTQTLFSTNRVVHTGDFPANDGTHTGVAIKFRVRAKDTTGHYWRYLSGTFNSY